MDHFFYVFRFLSRIDLIFFSIIIFQRLVQNFFFFKQILVQNFPRIFFCCPRYIKKIGEQNHYVFLLCTVTKQQQQKQLTVCYIVPGLPALCLGESTEKDRGVVRVKELGCGCFGTVYKVQAERTGGQAALKVQMLRSQSLYEVEAMRRIQGAPFTIELLDAWKDCSSSQVPTLNTLLTFHSGGTLDQAYDRKKMTDSIAVHTLRLISAQIVCGLDYIHCVSTVFLLLLFRC